MRTLLSDSDAQHEQPQRDDAAQNTRLAQFRQLLASSPWQIQFSSAYIAAFGVALAICNLFASRFPSSVVPSLVATALALIVEYTLVRFCFVRWLLVVWGGFNIVLLLCGPREFSFLWPFNVSFVAVAALLVMPSVRQWYRREYLVDATSGFNSLKRVFATGVGLAIVASIILLSGYKSERNRTRKSRDGYSCKDSYESSYSPSVYSSSSSCGSPQNARGAIERALMNVKERYQNMLRRYNLVESLYIDREDMCQLILVEPSGDTPLYTIRYWKSSNELEWSRLIPRDVAEQFLHDRMLMDSYKKVLSSDK